MKNKDKKRGGARHRTLLSRELRAFLVRMRVTPGVEKAHLRSQCVCLGDMASTESEDWTVEEDGEPTGEPVASTTSARATSSDREEEEEEMADEGCGVEEEEQQQQEQEALGSPEEVRVAAASEEDSDLVQTEATEGEDGYEAAEEDEQDTLDLDEEEGE